MNYYNENNPEAVFWLRELIKAGEIPPGDVDDRSIEEVKPHEIAHYTQQHFFAGVGGWALALRLAGWPDARPVRSASCPCQPFSQTGKQLGFADKRHLWPVCRDLITFGEPTITFGEQVASPLGREWLAGVRADMEGVGYEVGSADLCAAGVQSPHIRQRLYWVAYTKHGDGRSEQQSRQSGENGRSRFARSGEVNGLCSRQITPAGINRLEHTARDGREQRRPASGGRSVVSGCGVDGMGHADGAGSQGRDQRIFQCAHQWPVGTSNLVVRCEDGKYRRFEPGSFPLAHGVSGRVGLLRGYGNAIVPQLAAEFIQAAVEAIGNG